MPEQERFSVLDFVMNEWTLPIETQAYTSPLKTFCADVIRESFLKIFVKTAMIIALS